MFFLFISNFLYALLCLLDKVALNYFNPILLVAFKMIIGGLVLFGFQYLVLQKRVRYSNKNIAILFIAAFFCIYLNYILQYLGLSYLTPTKTAFLHNLYPFCSAFLAYLFIKEKLSKTKWLGLFIGFLGIVPFLFSYKNKGILFKYFGLLSIADISIIAAIFACSFGWLLIYNNIRNNESNAIHLLAIIQIFGGLTALVHSGFYNNDNLSSVKISSNQLFLFVGAIILILVNLIANISYIKLFKRYSFILVSFSNFFTTFFVAILDWLIFNNKISLSFFFSSAIMFLGFYLFYGEELKEEGIE